LDEATLHRNIHEMRLIYEQEAAEAESRARQNTLSVVADSDDDPSIPEMRRELGQSLEHMESRFQCLDVDVRGNEGNLILICGDNAGTAENSNVISSSATHIAIPPAGDEP
jgi:hypothetical protein